MSPRLYEGPHISRALRRAGNGSVALVVSLGTTTNAGETDHVRTDPDKHRMRPSALIADESRNDAL